MITISYVPTREDAMLYPEFWISGPGKNVASRVLCPHEYHLTDSCPNCAADVDNDSIRVEGSELAVLMDLERAGEEGRRYSVTRESHRSVASTLATAGLVRQTSDDLPRFYITAAGRLALYVSRKPR